MNYEKLSGSIRAVIDRRPGDDGAYLRSAECRGGKGYVRCHW